MLATAVQDFAILFAVAAAVCLLSDAARAVTAALAIISLVLFTAAAILRRRGGDTSP